MPNARPSIVVICAALLLSCAACSKPKPIPIDEPPEPQATELREAIRAPIEKAKAVEGAVQEAAERQRAEIEAAGG